MLLLLGALTGLGETLFRDTALGGLLLGLLRGGELDLDALLLMLLPFLIPTGLLLTPRYGLLLLLVPFLGELLLTLGLLLGLILMLLLMVLLGLKLRLLDLPLWSSTISGCCLSALLSDFASVSIPLIR